MLASYAGHGKVVELLLERGADANARDHMGCTARMWASLAGFSEATKLLKAYERLE